MLEIIKYTTLLILLCLSLGILSYAYVTNVCEGDYRCLFIKPVYVIN